MKVETRSSRPPVRTMRSVLSLYVLSPVLGVEVLHSVDLDHDESAVVGLKLGIDVSVPALGVLAPRLANRLGQSVPAADPGELALVEAGHAGGVFVDKLQE